MASSATADIRFVASAHLGGAFVNNLALDINPAALVLPVAGNPTSESQPGYAIGGSLGAQFGNWIRWDIVDLGYSLNDQRFSFPLGPPQNSFSASSSMIVYGTGIRVGRFSPESRWHPFVSFGVGAAYSRLNLPNTDRFPLPIQIFPTLVFAPFLQLESWKGWGFEWDAGFGIEYAFADRGAAAIRFRYRQSDVSFRKNSAAVEAVNPLTYTTAFEQQTKQIRIFTIAFELSFIGP